MALLTENNRQYYEGAQSFQAIGTVGGGETFTTTFDTNLIFYAVSSSTPSYSQNNFKLYTSSTGLAGTYTEYTSAYTVSGNTITITAELAANTYVVVQLKKLDGGNYGNTVAEKAFGDVVEDNWGSYSYVSLNDIIKELMLYFTLKEVYKSLVTIL